MLSIKKLKELLEQYRELLAYAREEDDFHRMHELLIGINVIKDTIIEEYDKELNEAAKAA